MSAIPRAPLLAFSATLLVGCSDDPGGGGGGRDNREPVAYPGSTDAVEDGGPISGNVPVATDADGNLDPNGYSLVTAVAEGTSTLAADGAFTFDPGTGFQDLAAGASREVSFTYTASDDDGAVSAPAEFAITVGGANDAPTVQNALPDQNATTGTAFAFTVPADTFTDVDEGDTMTLSVTNLPGWLSFDAGTGALSGTPSAAGILALTVTATDASGATATDSFTLQVRSAAGNETYTYDDAGRLTSVTYADGSVVSYTYDMAGNVLSRTTTAP